MMGRILKYKRVSYPKLELVNLFWILIFIFIYLSDLKQLRSLGVVYFLHLLIYSSLEFTLTFLTHWKFQFTPMEQGYMFFVSGTIMAIAQGTFVRRIPSESVQFYASIVSVYFFTGFFFSWNFCWLFKRSCFDLQGLLSVAPAYVCIGMAQTTTVLYVGICIYALGKPFIEFVLDIRLYYEDVTI